MADGEFWVSKEGVTIGRHQIHFPGDGGARAIQLENRHALEDALAELCTVAEHIQTALTKQNQKTKNRERLLEQKARWEKARVDIVSLRQTLTEHEREWQFQQQSASEKANWQRLEQKTQLDRLIADIAQWEEKRSQQIPQTETQTRERQQQEQVLHEWQIKQEMLESEVRNAREALRQQELLVQKLQHLTDQISRDLSRVNQQEQDTQRRIDEAQEQWESLNDEFDALPIADELDRSLQAMLDQKQAQEQTMATLRRASEEAFRAQKQGGTDRQKLERQLEDAREKKHQQEMTMQACDQRLQQYREDYVRYGGSLEALEQMQDPQTAIPNPEKAKRSIAQLKHTIAENEAQMKALEPVNLAAVAELEHESARLAELEKQHADLHKALATLQAAIVRIDQETRVRMVDVFARVNEKFLTLFRLIFGGGHAEILLTGEEILDAGIVLKAQPLGKNNTSIHLLSGGEKTLTAIALVFAFFSLNPAPFCVLDEVDAPLDDANTRRFTELIRDMSAHTQFLLISHNRITMEAMQTLVGVTMRDPGISKIVSVDLLNAVANADKVLAIANDQF